MEKPESMSIMGLARTLCFVALAVQIIPAVWTAAYQTFTRSGIEQKGTEWVHNHPDHTREPVAKMFVALREVRLTEGEILKQKKYLTRLLDRAEVLELKACEQADRLATARKEDASLSSVAREAEVEVARIRIKRNHEEKWWRENIALLEQELNSNIETFVAAKKVADVTEGKDTLAPPQVNWWRRVTGANNE